MLDTPRPSPADCALQAARVEARVALTQPSALDFLQDWDRALQRACDVACRAGMSGEDVRAVCAGVQAAADQSGRGPDWVVRQVRRKLYGVLCPPAQQAA